MTRPTLTLFATLSLMALTASVALAQTQIGTDVRLTHFGPAGDVNADAFDAAIAYNGTDDEFLVVFRGKEGPVTTNDYELHAQRLDAATLAPIGGTFQVTAMGPAGDPDYSSGAHRVVYNPIANHYLVVWNGDFDGGPAPTGGDVEIFAQLIDASSGSLVGGLGGETRVSFTGVDGVTTSFAKAPQVAFNVVDNEYFVVWHSNEYGQSTPPAGTYNVFGQRLSASLALVGPATQLTTLSAPKRAQFPSVAYSGAAAGYLVAYRANVDFDGTYEAFGQAVTATGMLQGSRFQISSRPCPSCNGGASSPIVVENPSVGGTFVAWRDDRFGFADREVFGQPLGANHALVGQNIRLSITGTDTDGLGASAVQSIAHTGLDDELHIAYSGEHMNNANEAHVTVIHAVTFGPIALSQRVSDMGSSDASTLYNAYQPAIAYASGADQFLVAWEGDDDSDGQEGEFEIYGQLWTAGAPSCSSDAQCDDGNPCTDDACDVASGSCTNAPNNAACDDGDACTVGDSCSAGSCGAGAPANCDDGDPCTIDACDGATGACSYTPDPACGPTCGGDRDPCSVNADCCSGKCNRKKRQCKGD